MKRLPWSRLHVFPYSERAGTPATRLPNSVPQSKRVERAKKLRDLSLERLKKIHHGVLEHAQTKGRILNQVLLESLTKGPDASRFWVGGYTPNYLRVLVPFQTEEEARLMRNRIVSVRPESLLIDSNQGDMAFISTLQAIT